MANNKIDENFIKEKIFNKWKNEYIIVSNFNGSSKPFDVIHNKCGCKTSVLYVNLMRQKIPCKFCNPYSKKDTDIYIFQLNKKYGNEFSVLGKYINANEHIKVRHNICDTIFYPVASQLMSGVGKCPYCSDASNCVTTEIFKRKVFDKYNDEYEVLSEYINAGTPIKIRHNLCSYEYENVIPSEFLNKKSCLCPICTPGSKMITTESYTKRLDKLYSGKYSLENEYEKSSDYVCLKCNECNNNFFAIKTSVHNGTLSCPFCSDWFSYPEKFIKELFNQLHIDYVYQLSKKHFEWCMNYRYDFYLNDYNSIIEVHGIQHYNPKSQWYNKDSDDIKYNLALKNGISKYIIIDARTSSLEFIKESILNSELSTMFDLSNIDWIKCNKFAQHSIANEIYKLSDEGFNINDIKDKLNISDSTIYRYLKDRTA